jgi:dienelactone hydrolase
MEPQKTLVGSWALPSMLAAFLLVTPAPAQAGFKLYKAKESDTAFHSGGQTIKVLRFTPSEGEGPFPGIVLLFGLDGLDLFEKDKSIQTLYKTVAGKIADKGFVVDMVRYFDSTPLAAKDVPEVKKKLVDGVAGLKYQPLDPKLKKLYETWMATIQDEIAYLRENKDVNKDRVGVVGLSMGGFLGTSLAVEHPSLNISALVNVFGGLPPQQYEAVRKAKTLPPLLVMGGEEDEVVPVTFQRELYGLWCATDACREAHFYGNVGHAFFDKSRGAIDTEMALSEALPMAIRFLKRHVQGLNVEKK